jgi:hypothetical protein
MPRALRGSARLQSAKVLGPVAIAADGMPELLVHRLDDLAPPGPPTPEPLGPRRPALALGWADTLGARGPPPGLLRGVSLQALIHPVWPRSRGAHARQARGGRATQGTTRLCQGLLFGGGRRKAQAGAQPHGVDRQQQRAAFIPTPPGAPAHSSHARPPPRAPAGPPATAPDAANTRPAPQPAGAPGACPAPASATPGRRRAAGAGPSAKSRVHGPSLAPGQRAPTSAPHCDRESLVGLEARRRAETLYRKRPP